jgi:hypothetical protein
MLKRIVLFLALSAALVACSSSGTSGSTSGAGESVAPIDSSGASALPSDSTMPSESASPS